MSPKRGDIVLVFFPDSNQRTGKYRPALVVQGDNLGTGLGQSIVAMITTNQARLGHPSRIHVLVASAEGKASGLRADSVIATDNLATIKDNEIARVLGNWPDMASVDVALRYTLGLP